MCFGGKCAVCAKTLRNNHAIIVSKKGVMQILTAEITMTEPTERINKLRELYLSGPVMTENLSYCHSGRQQILWLKGYISSENAGTSRLRRTYAEAYVLKNMRPVINDDELIVGLPDFSELTDDEKRELELLYSEGRCIPPARNHSGHMTLDFEKLLRIGVEGLLDEVCKRRVALTFDDPEDFSRDEFYEGCEVELNALLELETHYVEYAKSIGRDDLAELLERVPRKSARNFREALESIHFYRFCLWDLYYYGRLDQYLIGFLEKDLADGTLTEDAAQELLDCFFLLPTAYITPNSSTVVMVGGRAPDGVYVENRLTRMSLKAISHVRLASCKVGLAVTDRTSEPLLRFALRLNAEGLTHPALFNDELITDAFVKAGFPVETARNYCNTGCVEMTPCACSGMWVVSPYHNLAGMFLTTLHEHHEVKTLDEFLDHFRRLLKERIVGANRYLGRWMLERSRNGSESMRVACLVNDCLARGKAVDEGGARYNQTEPNFLGMANVVDSLAALDALVFRSHEYTLTELDKILSENFEGNEQLRQRIIRDLPHFGTNEKLTDSLAVRLTKMIADCCKGVKNQRGAELLPGTFSYLEHERHGKSTGATPDGRLAGYPLASGSSAVQGRETLGPTAAMLSETCWDQSEFLGGVAINIKFSDNMKSDEKINDLLAFLRVFLKRGGFQLQINAVSRKTLEAARSHPDSYRDLVVRVGGFSAYFTKLSPGMQQEIIDRNEHSI